MGFETIFAVGGLALGAVGQGISYIGQQEAARTQEQFAILNATAQAAQASMQGKLATAQAALQAQQQRNQQVAGAAQAAAYRDEAANTAKAFQANAIRQMEEQARFRSMLRARQGSSGTVAGQGSQLDILTQTAELQALENAEGLYQANNQRRQLFRAAEGAQSGAEYSSIQSGIELMQGEARASAFRAQGVQAEINGLAGVSAARGAGLSALGGAIGGFGNLGFRAFDLNRLGAFRFNS